jgi:hypothetical protein
LRISKNLYIAVLLVSILGNGFFMWQNRQRAVQTRQTFAGTANRAIVHLNNLAESLTSPTTTWDDPDFRRDVARSFEIIDTVTVTGQDFRGITNGHAARLAHEFGQFVFVLSTPRLYGSKPVDSAALRLGNTSVPVDPTDRAVLERFGQALKQAGFPVSIIKAPQPAEPGAAIPNSAFEPAANAFRELNKPL